MTRASEAAATARAARSKTLKRVADKAMLRCKAEKIEITYTGEVWYVLAIPLSHLRHKLARPYMHDTMSLPEATAILDASRYTGQGHHATLEGALESMVIFPEIAKLLDAGE